VFWEHARSLVAVFAEPDWLLNLTPGQRAVFMVALAGSYKLGGVDVAEESVALPPNGSEGSSAGCAEERKALCLFNTVAIAWHDWVEVWEQFEAGKASNPGFLERIHLLTDGRSLNANSPAIATGAGR
jgi:hypothetical protein